MTSDEHDYSDDYSEDDVYGSAPEDYKQKMIKENHSFIPKGDEEKREINETIKTMDLKFIDGVLYQKVLKYTSFIGVESHYLYSEQQTQEWVKVDNEKTKEN